MNKNINIVPYSKHDLSTCDQLQNATDEEVIEVLLELLEWLQDSNWPVALPVINRIKSIELPLVLPIRSILRGDDDVWKYFIISHLLPNVSEKVSMELVTDLKRIISSPTKSEIFEEVVIVAKEFLQDSHKYT